MADLCHPASQTWMTTWMTIYQNDTFLYTALRKGTLCIQVCGDVYIGKINRLILDGLANFGY